MPGDEKDNFEKLQQQIRDFAQAIEIMRINALTAKNKQDLSKADINELTAQIDFSSERLGKLEGNLQSLDKEQSAGLAKELQAISNKINSVKETNNAAAKLLNAKSNNLAEGNPSDKRLLDIIAAANKAIKKSQSKASWFASVDNVARLDKINKAVKAFELAMPNKESWQNEGIREAYEKLGAEQTRLKSNAEVGATFVKELDKVQEEKAKPSASLLRKSSIFKLEVPQGKFALSDNLKKLLNEADGLDEDWAQKMLSDLVGEKTQDKHRNEMIITEKMAMNVLNLLCKSALMRIKV